MKPPVKKRIAWAILYTVLAVLAAATLLPATAPNCPSFRYFSSCD